MAKTQTPAPGTDEKDKPSFTDIHAKSVADRTAELEAVTAPLSTEEKPPADEAWDFDKAWGATDERLRKAAEERIYTDAYGRYNKAIEAEYGDLLPILVAAKEDPALRKRLAKLTDKQVRDFLFDQALDVYDKTHIEEPAEGPKPDANAERLTALESKLDNDARERKYDKYVEGLATEFGALRNEFADDLNFSSDKDPQYKRANHLFKVWDTRFAASAARAGVNINRAPHLWVTEALDKGIKAPTYRELYDELHEVEGRSRPPAAPVGDDAGPPKIQAPRTAAEGRERALQLVKRAGGINGLQASFNARKRGAR